MSAQDASNPYSYYSYSEWALVSGACSCRQYCHAAWAGLMRAMLPSHYLLSDQTMARELAAEFTPFVLRVVSGCCCTPTLARCWLPGCKLGGWEAAIRRPVL